MNTNNSRDRVDINNPVALEQLLSFRRRQWKQAILEPKGQRRDNALATIKRKGLWCAKRLQRINATVLQGCMEYNAMNQV
jgi:hypothetical protein